MGAKKKDRKFPLAVRLEKDVEKVVHAACVQNSRTPPAEVNFQLRKVYNIEKK